MSPLVIAAIILASLALVGVIILLARNARRGPESGDISLQIASVREDLHGLRELFLVPRTRGAVGETLLAELLSAWLPRSGFELQYGFQNGSRVDAVVRLGSKLVPVDSKFPLEATQRYLASEKKDRLPADVRKSVQKHLSDIAERYIRPSEGTMSFALMYVPSERVYTELFAGHDDDLAKAALERSVVPVSPSTLFLYLQTVAYGLRGLSLPERTEKLLGRLDSLSAELGAIQRSMEVAGGHLRNLTRSFDEASSKVDRAAVELDGLTRSADE